MAPWLSSRASNKLAISTRKMNIAGYWIGDCEELRQLASATTLGTLLRSYYFKINKNKQKLSLREGRDKVRGSRTKEERVP